jgi:NitT/TauT family transport system ATP-binding protein
MSLEPGGTPLAVSAQGIDKVFPGGVHALDRIDLAIRRNEFVTLLGPSGCGKTTLLRILAGLIAPTGGQVRSHTGDAEGARIAFVFQQPTLMPWANVASNVRLPLDLSGVDRVEAERRVRDALALVGLSESARAWPRELSGGMQMRVSIARALVTEPGLLLMDEPFGALDEITRSRLDREVRDLWARQKLTVVFVTHSIYEAVFLSTRVVVMSARPGRVVGEVAIEQPHPRTDAFRAGEAYAQYCRRLSELLAAGAEP